MKLFSKGKFEAKGGTSYGKDVLRVGRWVHPITGQDINMTTERLEKLARNTRRFADAGNKIPYPKGHNTDPEKNRGFWNGQLVLDDSGVLYGAVDVMDEKHREGLDNGTIDGVSVNIEFAHKDPKGNEYDEVITHICSTNYPVVTEQGGFMKLSAEAEGELGKDVLFMDFNPDQPRDESGRWSDIGGGSGLGDESIPKKHRIEDPELRRVFDKFGVKWTGDKAINYSGDHKDGHWSSYKDSFEGWLVQHNKTTGETKIHGSIEHVPGRTTATHKSAAEVEASMRHLLHGHDATMTEAIRKVSVGQPRTVREDDYLDKYVAMSPAHRETFKNRYMDEVIARERGRRGHGLEQFVEALAFNPDQELNEAESARELGKELTPRQKFVVGEHDALQPDKARYAGNASGYPGRRVSTPPSDTTGREPAPRRWGPSGETPSGATGSTSKLHESSAQKAVSDVAKKVKSYEAKVDKVAKLKEKYKKVTGRDYTGRGLDQFVEAVRPGMTAFLEAVEGRSGLAAFCEALDGGWDEADHPRDDHGKFSAGAGAVADLEKHVAAGDYDKARKAQDRAGRFLREAALSLTSGVDYNEHLKAEKAVGGISTALQPIDVVGRPPAQVLKGVQFHSGPLKSYFEAGAARHAAPKDTTGRGATGQPRKDLEREWHETKGIISDAKAKQRVYGPKHRTTAQLQREIDAHEHNLKEVGAKLGGTWDESYLKNPRKQIPNY